MFRSFSFTLNGVMPLLMHADDISAADELSEWRKAPENKLASKSGDDRSPPWTWQSHLYTDSKHVVIPSANIMVAIRQAGAKVIISGKKTYKELTQSGLLIDSEYCTFRCNGDQISTRDLSGIRELNFSRQAEEARALGFQLFCKRAKVGQSKHIRVRPRFDQWSVEGVIHIISPDISDELLAKLLELAGKCGLGDWRPAGKTPGPFGMFTAELSKLS